MTLEDLANEFIGHPIEFGEGVTITASRESFIKGGLKVLEEIEHIIDNVPISSLTIKIENKIKELRDNL